MLGAMGHTLYNGMLLGARWMVDCDICDKLVTADQVCALAMYVQKIYVYQQELSRPVML
jgi:hypothetical protein